MADNPLYPGYKPDITDENRLFPGYYPGTPMARNPKIPNLRYVGGINKKYSFSELTQEIDNLWMEISQGEGSVPGWFKARLIDDFKQNLKASITIDNAPVEELDDFDENELPGAFGISVNLNPLDWAKDPGKQASKTLNDWKNKVVNWGDVDNRFREQLWRQVVSDNPDFVRVAGGENLPFSKGPATAPMAEAAARSILRRTGAGSKYQLDFSGGNNPLALIKEGNFYKPESSTLSWDPTKTGTYVDASGVTQNYTGGWTAVLTPASLDDKLGDVGRSVVDFERSAQSSFTRDKNFDTFEKNSISAISFELRSDPSYTAIISSDAKLQNAYGMYQGKEQIITNMGAVSKKYDDVKKSLSKNLLEGGSSYTGANVDQLITAIDADLANLNTSVFGPVGTGLSAYDRKEAEQLQRMLTPYRQHLEDLKAKAADVRANIGSMNGLQKAAALRSLDATAIGGFKGKGITGGDLVVDSYQRQLLRNVTDEFTSGRPKGIGMVVRGINDRLPPDQQLKVTRLRAYMDRLSYERDAFTIDNLVQLVEKGNLMENLVWNRIKRNLEGFTPAFYAKHIMTKVNYGGLLISNDADFEKSTAYKMSTRIKKGLGLSTADPSQQYGNWFRVDYKTTIAADPMLGTPERNIQFSAKLYGGDHFKGMKGLGAISNMVDQGLWNKEALAYMISNIGPDGFNNATFMSELMRLNGGSVVLPAGIKPDEFAGQIIKFRDWVNANAVKFKLKGVNTADPVFWKGLIDSLKDRMGPSYIDITKRYAGSLQKVWQFLNIAQFKFLAKFGKYLAPISYIKTIITEAVSEFFIKLLDSAAAAASGGVLAAVTETLGKLLKPIIRFVVRKVLDLGEVVFKGLLQGDLSFIFGAMEKSLLAFLKIVLVMTAIPFIFILICSTLFGGVVLTTYSPVDPIASKSGIVDGDGHAMYHGSGAGLVNTTGVAATLDCFEFVNGTGKVNDWDIAAWDADSVSSQKKAWLQSAAANLKSVGGCYLDNLCKKVQAAPQKRVPIYNATKTATTGSGPNYCGYVSMVNNEVAITFTNVCNGYAGGAPQNYYNYLFAHETGHVTDNFLPRPTFPGTPQISFAWAQGEGAMPTYPATSPRCNGNPPDEESWAETIGNWVTLNLWDCGCSSQSWCTGSEDTTRTAFWNAYPKHKQFADKLFCAVPVGP